MEVGIEQRMSFRRSLLKWTVPTKLFSLKSWNRLANVEIQDLDDKWKLCLRNTCKISSSNNIALVLNSWKKPYITVALLKLLIHLSTQIPEYNSYELSPLHQHIYWPTNSRWSYHPQVWVSQICIVKGSGIEFRY